MTTHHTDEKKPAQGGAEEQVKRLQRPMLPSSRRCIWVGPVTEEQRWALKEQVERALERLDKALWAIDTQNGDDLQLRLDGARRDIISAMKNALQVEALLFERRPEDRLRQSTTGYFDSLSRR